MFWIGSYVQLSLNLNNAVLESDLCVLELGLLPPRHRVPPWETHTKKRREWSTYAVPCDGVGIVRRNWMLASLDWEPLVKQRVGRKESV